MFSGGNYPQTAARFAASHAYGTFNTSHLLGWVSNVKGGPREEAFKEIEAVHYGPLDPKIPYEDPIKGRSRYLYGLIARSGWEEIRQRAIPIQISQALFVTTKPMKLGTL